MKTGEEINCAQALVQVLENEGIELIFGHPGEQILAFYDALSTSPIKHVLFRHEQGAAHAADGYARASSHLGVCVATAGPGALNLVMGVATAYKDSVPLLVITGDVPTTQRGQNDFQDLDLCGVFAPITLESFNPQNSQEALLNLKKALKMLKNGPTGPIHLNLPKDILMGEIDSHIIQKEVPFNVEENLEGLKEAIEIIKTSKKPLILGGAGLIWSGALNEIKTLVEKHEIPFVSTYPARGVLGEDHPLCLGMIGTRGTPAGNYAGTHCDVILGLGCRFSERTLAGIGNTTTIQVNIDPKALKGDFNIHMDVKKFLNKISDVKISETTPWVNELKNYAQKHPAQYDIPFNYPQIPLKPQQAIKEIIEASKNSIIVNDAGTHTTWVTLYKKVLKPSSLIFSGGFGPMGYALPAGIGAGFSTEDESIVAITGDGSFQMTLQELATLQQEKLPLVVCIINNSSLGIIRQWQELYHSGPYEVELDNPDFVELARSYKIKAARVDSPGEVFKSVKKAISLKKPCLIEIIVDPAENIPLPKIFSEERQY